MIKLVITKGENQVDLEASVTNADHVTMALEGAFGVFNGQATAIKVEIPVAPSEPLNVKQAREVATAKNELKAIPTPAPAEKETQTSRPRAVELLNNNRSLQVPIAEVADLSNMPEWYETGIKLKDGVPHYRTRYWCQNDLCKNQGNHYVPLNATTTACHDCGLELELRPAIGIVGADGIPERDQFGNFFRADTTAGE